jgi:hypothetical protein
MAPNLGFPLVGLAGVEVKFLHLMIRKMLGYYQITSQIGKGGVGEVYQAKGCEFKPNGLPQ